MKISKIIAYGIIGGTLGSLILPIFMILLTFTLTLERMPLDQIFMFWRVGFLFGAIIGGWTGKQI